MLQKDKKAVVRFLKTKIKEIENDKFDVVSIELQYSIDPEWFILDWKKCTLILNLERRGWK